MTRKTLIMLFLSAVAVLSGLSAQPRILPVTEISFEESALSDVAERTVNVEILRAGFLIEPWVHFDPTNENFKTVIRKAKDTESEFIFFQKLKRTGQDIDTDFSFLEAKKGRVILQRRQVFPFDLNLDSHIAREVQILLAAAEVKEAVDSAAKTAPPRPPADSAAPPAAIPAPGAAGPMPAAVSAVPAKGFVLGAHAAPVLLFGQTSELFPYGMSASVFGGYRFAFLNLPAETGIRIGAVQIFPDQSVSDGKVYTLAVGWEIKTDLLTTGKMNLAFRASAGPAVVVAQIPDTGTLAKTVAYGEAGIAAGVRLSRRTEIGMELGYIAVFEDDYPIMGFMPTMILRFFP